MVPQNEWFQWLLVVFIMENPIQMDGYYGGYYNEINGGTQKIPIAGWFVNGKSYFSMDDLGVAYFRTPPYLNQSSLLYV